MQTVILDLIVDTSLSDISRYAYDGEVGDDWRELTAGWSGGGD